MTTCNDDCPACSKQCEKDPGHETYPGKINQIHHHDYAYVARNSKRRTRVVIIHEWRSDA